MKKVFVLFMVCMMICGVCYARMSDVSTERCQNIAERPVMGTLTAHRTITGGTADTFTYGSGDTDKIDLSNTRRVLVYAKTTNSITGWNLTPCFGDATASTYFYGTTTNVTNDAVYILDTYGCKEFMMRCTGATGTGGTCTVYIQELD